MADYNSIALSNAEKGWYVFPVQGKLPYEGFMWKEESSNDPEIVALWITDSRYTGCNWAIDLSKSGKTVIDIDQHPDKPNGFETAKKLGFTTEADFSFQSISGSGQHNWYDNTYKQANGLYPGIDRKSGEGAYVVAPYELPYLEDIYQPVPKEYAIERVSNELGIKYAGSVQQWLEAYWGLPTHPDVDALVADFAVKGISGNTLVFKIIVKLVFMALEGKGGVPEAIEQLEKIWMKSPHSSGEAKAEWDRALWRAIAANGGGIQVKNEDTVDDDLERKIVAETERRYIARQAELRLAAMDSEGTQLVTRADIVEQSWLIKDWIAAEGLNVLFGNSNLGKSFIFMDMWASACIYGEWMGAPAKPFKALFVLGEGAYEFYKRLDAWCLANEIGRESLDAWAITYTNGVMTSEKDRREWSKTISNDPEIKLVIWDTYIATAGINNEDSSGEVSAALRFIKELGSVAHLLIHHPPKDKENATKQYLRGSTALKGAADVIVNLAAESKDDSPQISTVKPAEGTSWMRVSTKEEHGGKKRGAKRSQIDHLYLEEVKLGIDEFGEPLTSLVVRRLVGTTEDDVTVILRHLADKEMTYQQILDDYNYDNPYKLRRLTWVKTAVKKAITAGKVEIARESNGSTSGTFKRREQRGIFF